ncbi:MqnA/MqnD/SBP family protein [Halarcobacter anaerophilus]|uniref:MqnA/MqnD/SBP family protein n=1 Tax=Halarcobacter anaerophilus TaxID=877500 RepID=UPI0005CA8A52|nr:MqnA/MqnD/SBP family protein [Halarcobacter anaerophilus]
MIFAKIDFINLLPVHVFLKKRIQSSQIKSIINYKKSYPSKINKKLKKSKVDSAFVSSIASRGEKRLDYGIIARKNVRSVFLIPGKDKEDYQSQTSNALAKILNLHGEVLIGDKALKFFHENPDVQTIDLALEWEKKFNLPFVFATLCYRKNGKMLKNIMKDFNKRQIKIPQYILNEYSKRSNISNKNILEYLKLIDYDIKIKEKRAIKKFLSLTKQKGF